MRERESLIGNGIDLQASSSAAIRVVLNRAHQLLRHTEIICLSEFVNHFFPQTLFILHL